MVQEAIIVIKDIFRKYPGKYEVKYEVIIKDLCENLKQLDNSEAKASMIWIVGHYAQIIDNSLSLMSDFADTFKEEPKNPKMCSSPF